MRTVATGLLFALCSVQLSGQAPPLQVAIRGSMIVEGVGTPASGPKDTPPATSNLKILYPQSRRHRVDHQRRETLQRGIAGSRPRKHNDGGSELVRPLLAGLLAISAWGQDWPQFRGSPALTGLATGAAPEVPLRVLWQWEGGESVESSAAIAAIAADLRKMLSEAGNR